VDDEIDGATTQPLQHSIRRPRRPPESSEGSLFGSRLVDSI
jgi:hypothetical protein